MFNSTKPFDLTKDTRKHQPADLSRGGNKPKYSEEEIAKAMNILGMPGNVLAEELKINKDGPHVRNFVGSFHLMVRSILQPLIRIESGQVNERKAQGAFSTSSFILDKFDSLEEAKETGDQEAIVEAQEILDRALSGMMCDDPVKMAKLSTKVAKAELRAADKDFPVAVKLTDVINREEFVELMGGIYKYSYDVLQTIRLADPKAKHDLETFADCLDKGMKWVSQTEQRLKAALSPELAKTADAAPAKKL